MISRSEIVLACCCQTNLTEILQAAASLVPTDEIQCQGKVHRICNSEPTYYKLQYNAILFYKTKTDGDGNDDSEYK